MTFLCPLCQNVAACESAPNGQAINCRQCGKFTITSTAEVVVAPLDHRIRRKIGFWTRDQDDLGEKPVVTSDVPDQVSKLPDLSVMERSERLLRFAISQQKDLGGRFSLDNPSVVGKTHSHSDGDVQALARLMWQKGWMHDGFESGPAQVSPQGFMYASDSPRTDSSIAFIAMWFDQSMAEARISGLEAAIRNAGYTPIVVNGVEHVNKIDDEIISQIRRSKFLVADFTGHRGGVYFEAGFAMGLGLPVIWTCRKDQLAALHFDVRQYNCIDWTEPAELATRLQRRIEAVIGRGRLAG